MRVILRQANITFSRDFVKINQQKGILLTRRSVFRNNAICINHGNSAPIRLRPRVTKFYLLNKPEAIHYCSNKMDNYFVLREFYPRTYPYPEHVQRYPVIVKPIYGHHGYGIKICNDARELNRMVRGNHRSYIIQDLVKIKGEYRFNVIDGDIYQVSKKEYLGDAHRTPHGGFEFAYKSLGMGADISPKFWRFVNNIIGKFHNKIGIDLADYGIDIMKDTKGKYYLTEINSAYGIGEFTLEKLIEIVSDKYYSGKLDKYRVR